MIRLSRKCGSFDVSQTYGPPQSVTGTVLLISLSTEVSVKLFAALFILVSSLIYSSPFKDWGGFPTEMSADLYFTKMHGVLLQKITIFSLRIGSNFACLLTKLTEHVNISYSFHSQFWIKTHLLHLEVKKNETYSVSGQSFCRTS
jgi:hypothetical protein